VFEFGALNGGERSMLAVLPLFVGSDWEFIALAPAASPLAAALDDLGVPAIPFAVRGDDRRRPAADIDAELDAVIRRVKPDLLHANSLSMGRLTGAATGRTGTPATAHLRDIVRLSTAAVERLNANRALIAVSQAVREFHSGQGIDAARLRVVYNGIDARQAALRLESQRASGLRGELGLPAEAFLAATVGQICLRKGQDVFARAAVLAAADMPQAHFLLIGQRHSSKRETVEYEASIAREFKRAGLAGRFHPLGYRADMHELWPQLDLLVHAARQEPFGRVLLEAAVSGCPIVATGVGGTPEILADQRSALLVEPEAPRRIADAMIRLYSDAALRQRLSAVARIDVAQRFALERCASQLADVWRGVLD
jgi:glycosyltransferase involved in cell wall biosynthesis